MSVANLKISEKKLSVCYVSLNFITAMLYPPSSSTVVFQTTTQQKKEPLVWLNGFRSWYHRRKVLNSK